MSDVTIIINEHENTHGDYTNTARIIQTLKTTVHSEHLKRRDRKQPPLSHVQLESLDMILCKIGRILSGDPNTKDHWDDIAGYAQLASMRIATAPVEKQAAQVVAQSPEPVKVSKMERVLASMVGDSIDNNGKHF